MRICTKCGERKDYAEFHVGRNKCKTCRKEERAASYAKNRDKELAQNRAWVERWKKGEV